jgi:hypothetical protein
VGLSGARLLRFGHSKDKLAASYVFEAKLGRGCCVALEWRILYILRSSFELVQISVWRGTTQLAAHGNDLALVMERMGQDMMEDERRSADGAVSIGEMKFRIGIELLICQARQIGLSPPADLLLQESGIRDTGTFGGAAIDVAESLQRVNPKSFAVEDVNHLFLQRREPETGQFLHIIASVDSGQVIEQEIEAGVGPAVKFLNAIEGEHESLLASHDKTVSTESSANVQQPGS